MSEHAAPHAEPAAEAGAAAPRGGRIGRLIQWVAGSRLRTAIAGGVGLTALVVMFACWSLLAHVAVESLTPVSISLAYEALDQQRFEEARSIVGELQNQPATPELLSGALFVLGAAKSQEADLEATSERRRSMHQLAARYLQQAVDREMPALRRRQADLLLGRSLVMGGEPASGIAILEEALRDPARTPQEVREVHGLLVSAYLDSPLPKFKEGLDHNLALLSDKSLSPDEHDQALARHADMLIRLNRPAEARGAIDQIRAGGALEADKEFLLGRLLVDEALQLKPQTQVQDDKLEEAKADFRKAQSLDKDAGPLSRQAMYWIARCYDLQGETLDAISEYDRLAKLFADQPEGIAATMALADHYLRQDELPRSLEHYHTTLLAVGDPATYVNPILPLTELKSRVNVAYQALIDGQNFSEALALVDMLELLLDGVERADLSARTQREWGHAQIAGAAGRDDSATRKQRSEGRRHLRAAGVEFEKVAAMRYATRSYPDDLWTAADCYFQGQSFTSAERLLEMYLHEESRRDNAAALLRLGQSRLARRDFELAVATFEECVELYPQDLMAYQARLECARAYQQAGQFERAESLLTANLTSERLDPRSAEWRDSLFALGRLLYDSQRYDDAIAKLQEAVERYDDADQTLLAKYTIARASHSAAEAPAKKLREAKSENERQKNRKLTTDYLEAALDAYVDVQRTITLRGHSNTDPLSRELLLNCYMMKGSVLYELRRFEEARQAYGNVVTLYENQPIVLESLVQMANCWRRLDEPAQARVTLQRAKLALSRLPEDADYLAATNFDRQKWQLLIDQMSKW